MSRRRPKGMRRVLFTVVALVFVAGACGDDDETGTGSGGDALWGRTFLSTDVSRELVEGTRIRLGFVEAGRQLTANAGCNHLFGDVTGLDGGVLEVGLMGGTEMGCDPERHEQDEWLMAFLTSSPAWALDGDTLTLTGDTDTIVLLDRVVADPDRPLEGTTWVVDGIVDGDAVSSVPQGAEAQVEFADGTVSGNAGCNTFSGDATVAEGSIDIDWLGMTDLACDEPATTLEAAVFATLRGIVAYEIEAGSLTLTGPDGHGLLLRSLNGFRS